MGNRKSPYRVSLGWRSAAKRPNFFQNPNGNTVDFLVVWTAVDRFTVPAVLPFGFLKIFGRFAADRQASDTR